MFNKQWIEATLIRAIRTFAEAALSYMGSSALVLQEINWLGVLSAGALGFVTAILLALKGLPEVDLARQVDAASEEKECPVIVPAFEHYEENGDPTSGHVTVLAHNDYDEDGSPVVDGGGEDA